MFVSKGDIQSLARPFGHPVYVTPNKDLFKRKPETHNRFVKKTLKNITCTTNLLYGEKIKLRCEQNQKV